MCTHYIQLEKKKDMKRVNVFLPQCLSLIFALRFHFISFLFFGAFQGFNEIYFVFFSFAHCAV